MVIECLYEPQRASQSLYMTELRNTHFIGRIELQGGTDSMAKAMTNKLSCIIGIQRKKRFKNISYSRNQILEH